MCPSRHQHSCTPGRSSTPLPCTTPTVPALLPHPPGTPPRRLLLQVPSMGPMPPPALSPSTGPDRGPPIRAGIAFPVWKPPSPRPQTSPTAVNASAAPDGAAPGPSPSLPASNSTAVNTTSTTTGNGTVVNTTTASDALNSTVVAGQGPDDTTTPSSNASWAPGNAPALEAVAGSPSPSPSPQGVPARDSWNRHPCADSCISLLAPFDTLSAAKSVNLSAASKQPKP